MSQMLQDRLRTFCLEKTTLEAGAFDTREDLVAQKIPMQSARGYKTPKKEMFQERFEDKPPSPYKSFILEKVDDETA